MTTNVVGLFDDREDAATAVRDLREKGFSNEQISLVAADPKGELRRYQTDESGNRAGEGASIGAASGLLIGGVIGFLAGAGMILLPGGFLAIGPLAGALGGAVAGGIAGGIVGGLIGLGVPREHAEVYAEGVRRGGTLVTVRCNTDEGVDIAEKILDRDGAVDVDERGSQYRAEGFTGYDPKQPVYTEEEARAERERRSATVQQERVPVVEETATVEKQQVPVGGVRVRRYVTEQPVREEATVREEHVNVERRPADRPLEPTALNAFEEGTIEIPEMTEVPVVTKEPRVVQEVVINKQAVEQPASVEDTVRRTDVVVERIGADASSQAAPARIDYRDHYQGHYAQHNMPYEQVEPAYSYGERLAQEEHLRGREWRDVEPDIQRHWETRNPRTWDFYRDAVQAGYERARARTSGARLL